MSTARTNALISGEIHYINRVDLKTIDMLKQNPDIEIDNVTGFGHYVAPMNVTRRPSTMSMSALALKYAINREDLVDKMLLGYGTPGNDNPIAPAIKFATNPEPVYSYDPEKAKFHLKKAAWRR